MKGQKSELEYKLMVNVGMPIRNLFMPPEKMLQEADIKPGYQVLDYGCGPGTFTLRIAERVGAKGMVYALDIHPLAKKYVEQKVRSKKLSNVKVILSDCATSLPENSIDYVIMFDVYHELENPKEILMEIKRVLKPNGELCFSDHHMDAAQIIDNLTKNEMFVLEKKGARTLSFRSL